MSTIQNVKGHGLNEKDVILPSHVAKICHKSGRCQHCTASWRLLTNRTQGISHVSTTNFSSKKETLGVHPLNIVIIMPHNILNCLYIYS